MEERERKLMKSAVAGAAGVFVTGADHDRLLFLDIAARRGLPTVGTSSSTGRVKVLDEVSPSAIGGGVS